MTPFCAENVQPSVQNDACDFVATSRVASLRPV